MQYSSNSNAAVLGIIRSCPTLIGQYRQAIMHMRDRQLALENHQLVAAKQEQIIKLKRIEIEELLPNQDDPKTACKIALIKIEINQAEWEERQTEELVLDAQREIAVCRSEIARILSESNIDFRNISEAGFQMLMGEEYRQKQVRWIAARTLAARLGIPPDAAEAILELPEGDRVDYMRMHHQLLDGIFSEFKQIEAAK